MENSQVDVNQENFLNKAKNFFKSSFTKAKDLAIDVFKRRDYYKVVFKKKFLGTDAKGGIIINILVYFLLIVFGFVFLYPLLFMMITSVKTMEGIADSSVKWVPTQIALIGNYSYAMEQLNYGRTLFNSIVVAALPSAISTVICCLTGYGFARFDFPGKKIWFALLLASFLLPGYLLSIPRFAWYSNLGLVGTLWTYIIPSTLGQGLNSVIFILLFWSNFKQLPKQLEESARLDGATPLTVFFKIALPLAFSTIVTVFIFSVVWYWNDTANATLYLSTGEQTWVTLPLMVDQYEAFIASFVQGEAAKVYNGYKMACIMLTIIPLLILYFSLQRFFVESVEKSGIAGE